MTLRLHGTYTSPYVRHCRIALLETEQEFELVETDYAQSAAQAPARRVPFLHDGKLVLNDSLSILQHVRERAGQRFLHDVRDTDLFALTNTALDTAVNLFLLEKDGLTPDHAPYLGRQAGRVQDILDALEERAAPRREAAENWSDGELRLGCFLGWALFRERLTLDQHPALAGFLDRIGQYQPFSDTRPFVA